MKKFLILILITINGLSAQSRINSETITYHKESDYITEATGWCINSSGIWVGNKNLIYTSESPRILKLGLSEQNFIKMNSASFFYEGKKYYVINVYKYRGSYILEEWTSNKIRDVFIFTERDFNKLRKFKKTLKLVTNKHKMLFNDSEELLKSAFNSSFGSKYHFRVYRSDEGKIRFLLPQSKYYAYDSRVIRNNRYCFDDIESSYFEISEEEFNKLISI